MASSYTAPLSLRDTLFAYAKKHYQTTPVYLWRNLPGYAVLRHPENQKWYALLLCVPREKAGLTGDGMIDLMDVKCDPVLAGSLRAHPGILPGYHMNKAGWISLCLDGSVETELLFPLLDPSYLLTLPPQTRRAAAGPRDWLIPANPAYFDVEAAFEQSPLLLWTQRAHIHPKDTVYLYMGAPISALGYACDVVETDLPRIPPDPTQPDRKQMKLRLLHRFAPTDLPFSRLKELDVRAVRGPRNVPAPLKEAICQIWPEAPRPLTLGLETTVPKNQ